MVRNRENSKKENLLKAEGRDSVPHIVLLASGGGQRAAVSLVGSLYQMAQDGLLDSLLYLGGVSGSTWSMASLYSDPEWSWNMDRAQSRLSGDGVELQDALGWLNKTAAEDGFSLSDVWGVLTSAGIMKQMDERRLSDEANRNASNPYPIYSAVEKHCYSHGPIEGTSWFEVSPHEAGFTELDLFVNTSLLGSKFQMGDLLEKKPEMDMIKLQGVCSSCINLIRDSKAGIRSLAGTQQFNKSVLLRLCFMHCLTFSIFILPLFWRADSTVPACLLMEERFQLVDAGALINVGYPPFLGDKRDIDLIIAPEYSAGDMFEVLDYAAKVKKPFPVIDDRILEDRDWPKDCYVFDGKENEPTIIYMPLFNRHNCKGLEHDTVWSTAGSICLFS
uniref:Cytosolic phospholipase A2 gamma-like n=1 Tax=Salarias fasciatus TaxID=181472 RepID=A0A672G380_SALFA